MLNKGVFILLLLGVIAGCKAKKAVLTGPPPAVPETNVVSVPAVSANNSKSDKLVSIKKKTTTFNTFSTKAKAALSIGKNSNDVTMNIRIKNNEAIWVSVTAIAGLEVARALITPDSVKVINRLENEYIKKPFSYIYEFTNDKINFGTLQSVLIGNTIPEFINEATEVTIQGNQTQLKSVITSMIYNVMVNEQDKVTETRLNDDAAGQSLLVNYGEFQPVADQQIPHSILMKSHAKAKNITLNLSFSKVDINVPVDMPFRVPERFVIKN